MFVANTGALAAAFIIREMSYSGNAEYARARFPITKQNGMEEYVGDATKDKRRRRLEAKRKAKGLTNRFR